MLFLEVAIHVRRKDKIKQVEKSNSFGFLKELLKNCTTNDELEKYYTTMMARSKKVSAIVEKRAVMTEMEMKRCIEALEKHELFEKLKRLSSNGDDKMKQNCRNVHMRYLKSAMTSLIRLGYDEHWVNTTFREALEKRYAFRFE